MSKLKSQVHDVVVFLLLDYDADVCEDLNSLVTDIFPLVVEHLI
jgi:hypothetical protein